MLLEKEKSIRFSKCWSAIPDVIEPKRNVSSVNYQDATWLFAHQNQQKGHKVLISIAISAVLFVVTAYLHLAALRFCSGRMASVPMRPHTRVLAVVSLLFVTHLFQIALFAGGFWIAEAQFGIGGFEGAAVEGPIDYLYFSAVMYTSLGIGDIIPIGHLRFLVGIEALNGLLLIAWSASFLFATMNRLWDWKPCVEPGK